MNLLTEISEEFNYQIQHFNFNDIITLSNLIINKSVYLTGIGKSQNMAFHCGDLLKSVGIKAYNLNANKALHGDIGTIKNEDLVIFFSNSGNTSELIPLIEHLNISNIFTIGICCNPNSKFKEICSKTFVLPFQRELSMNNINSVPTNSIMSQILFINLLVTTIINKTNLQITDYKYNHPAGNIGKNLKSVKDCIIKDIPKFILKEEFYLNEILIEMTKYSYGFCCFINENNELCAVISDGDIRRIIINNNDNNDYKISKNKLNYNYYSIMDQNILISTINKRYKYIPIINESNILQGLVKL
jgi:arabinose-5-phosphate isomerase